jgi:hypothetical protein
VYFILWNSTTKFNRTHQLLNKRDSTIYCSIWTNRLTEESIEFNTKDDKYVPIFRCASVFGALIGHKVAMANYMNELQLALKKLF